MSHSFSNTSANVSIVFFGKTTRYMNLTARNEAIGDDTNGAVAIRLGRQFSLPVVHDNARAAINPLFLFVAKSYATIGVETEEIS